MAEATIKIIFVWTEKVKSSIEIKKKFENSGYGQLISFVSADSADVRNMLLYGKYPQIMVPVFIVQESDGQKQKTSFYQLAEIDKIFALMDQLLEGMEQPHDAVSSITIKTEHMNE